MYDEDESTKMIKTTILYKVFLQTFFGYQLSILIIISLKNKKKCKFSHQTELNQCKLFDEFSFLFSLMFLYSILKIETKLIRSKIRLIKRYREIKVR